MGLNKFDKAHMKAAEVYASLSYAQRLKVGAVVVKDNRIISIGYNGTPAGWSNVCEDIVVPSQRRHDHPSMTEPVTVTKPEVIHAEANAIMKLASSHESGKGATMYVTHAPCMDCAKLIHGAGIERVVYSNLYRNDHGLSFLKKCGVTVEQL